MKTSRAERTADLIERLPARFKGRDPDLTRARFRLRVDRTIRDVVIDGDDCDVERPSGTPDVEICTDAATWREMDQGRLSGIEAFAGRRVVMRGSIEKSLYFEPMFTRPDRGALTYSMERVSLGGVSLSVLITGPQQADPLVLLHGLGATKASWLTVVPALARRYRVIAVDLPGFGASSKPFGRYDASWFADHVFALLDALRLERAFVAGNSMGGRIAMEMGMTRPDRISGIACLCPAAAFSHRRAVRLVRLLRPELGVTLAFVPRDRLKEQVKQLFADPSRLQETWYDAAIDDFRRVWRSPRARLAFFAALRNIYLDEPDGEAGFWARLAQMRCPALYIYGDSDVLISPRFATKIQAALPSAQVAVWDDCGHVPQIEYPERTAGSMIEFLGRAGEASKAG